MVSSRYWLGLVVYRSTTSISLKFRVVGGVGFGVSHQMESMTNRRAGIRYFLVPAVSLFGI